MTRLQEARVPFLVGGAYAFARYTGIVRHTKDFDIFVHPRDFERTLEELKRIGCSVSLPFPHWLGKGYWGDDFVDVIFSSGNGIARVDDLWFEHAMDEEVLGIPARLCPAEEMIWSKAFIQERERFDGGDVAHVLRARVEELDWDRLLSRFGPHWPVLLSHLILFGYIYPADADRIPSKVMDSLIQRLRHSHGSSSSSERLCRGTILSRSQYLVDIEKWGYRDARMEPVGSMSPEELEIWTRAAEEEVGRSYTEVEEAV
ncbi:MAG TPA: hypothetical protein VN493_29960 [Thermoanaerobaculia bacterium]|nr:hypothetical protein [Thermoanaerobaculia bacterium]